MTGIYQAPHVNSAEAEELRCRPLAVQMPLAHASPAPRWCPAGEALGGEPPKAILDKRQPVLSFPFYVPFSPLSFFTSLPFTVSPSPALILLSILSLCPRDASFGEYPGVPKAVSPV